ncbi:60S ribosomal protein L14 [Entamoeba marina]
MVFTKFVEVGRVVLIRSGAHSNKIAVIVEILDHNRVLVDGPQAITGVPRHVINLKAIELTSIHVKNVTRGMTHAKLCLRFNHDSVLKRFNKTNVAKSIARKQLREKMTDFDRYRVRTINRKINTTAKIHAATAMNKAK